MLRANSDSWHLVFSVPIGFSVFFAVFLRTLRAISYKSAFIKQRHTHQILPVTFTGKNAVDCIDFSQFWQKANIGRIHRMLFSDCFPRFILGYPLHCIGSIAVHEVHTWVYQFFIVVYISNGKNISGITASAVVSCQLGI